MTVDVMRTKAYLLFAHTVAIWLNLHFAACRVAGSDRSITTLLAQHYAACKEATKSKTYTKVVEHASVVLYFDPRYHRALRYRGAAYINLGQPDKALWDFTTARDLCEHDWTVYLDCAAAYDALERWESSLRMYERASKLNSKSALAFRGQGYALLKLGRAKLSILALDTSILLDGTSGKSYYYRAYAQHLGGSYKAALRDYEKALTLWKDNWEVHMNFARILATCEFDEYRDGQKAQVHARKACELTMWKEPLCIEALAASCAEVRLFDEAIKWQLNAISMYQNERDLLCARSRLESYKNLTPVREGPPSR